MMKSQLDNEKKKPPTAGRRDEEVITPSLIPTTGEFWNPFTTH